MRLHQVDSQCKICVKPDEGLYRNLFNLSYFGCAQERQVRGNIVSKGVGGLDVEVCDTSRTASVAAVSPVMYLGIHVYPTQIMSTV